MLVPCILVNYNNILQQQIRLLPIASSLINSKLREIMTKNMNGQKDKITKPFFYIFIKCSFYTDQCIINTYLYRGSLQKLIAYLELQPRKSHFSNAVNDVLTEIPNYRAASLLKRILFYKFFLTKIYLLI